jgi:hypothetical protein
MKSVRVWFENVLGFLEEQPVWSQIYFSVFYLGCTLTLSRGRQFWYDELATYYMALLPDFSTIMAALKGGADLNPPLLYLATKASHSLFGTGEVATRMPATMGFLLMELCLYRMVSFRASRPIAFATMLFPMVTGAYQWAIEARPYGMVLGFSTAGAMFWQECGAERRPRVGLVAAMCLLLTMAISAHAYAVFAVAPVLLAEAVRWWRSRELRWPVWVGLVAPFAALAFYAPLVGSHNAVAVDNSLLRPNVLSIAKFYHLVLDPALFPLLLVFVYCLWGRRTGVDERVQDQDVPNEEVALIIGYLLVPVGAFAAAILVTRMFLDRYALAAIIGASLLFAMLLARSGKRFAPLFAALVFGLWTFGDAGKFSDRLMPRERGPEAPRVEDLRRELPVVVSTGMWFWHLVHYADATYAGRLTYLVDRAAAIEHTGADVFDVAYPILKKWHRIPGTIVSYSEFMKRREPFLVYGSPVQPLDWLVRKLIVDGASVRVVAIRPEGMVWEVTPAR